MRNLNFGDRLIIFMVSTVLALPLTWFGNETATAPSTAWRSTSNSSVAIVNTANALSFADDERGTDLSPDERGTDLSPDGCKPRKERPHDTIFC